MLNRQHYQDRCNLGHHGILYLEYKYHLLQYPIHIQLHSYQMQMLGHYLDLYLDIVHHQLKQHRYQKSMNQHSLQSLLFH